MYDYHVFQSGKMFIWNVKSDNEALKGSNSHCHKEYELLFFINGEAEYRIEGRVYHLVSDSLLLIPTNYYHQWLTPKEKTNHRIAIHFLPEMLNKAERGFFLDLFAEPLYFINSTQHDLNFYIKSITECELMDTSLQEMAVKSRMIALLTQIRYLRSTKAVKPVILDERIRNMLTYIGNNLDKDIYLDSLSEQFLITKNHLNFLFQKIVGTTIMKYITIKRLGIARQEIIEGARPTEAAYKAGFNDYTTFYRAYKSFYGSAPSELLTESTDSIKS